MVLNGFEKHVSCGAARIKKHYKIVIRSNQLIIKYSYNKKHISLYSVCKLTLLMIQ